MICIVQSNPIGLFLHVAVAELILNNGTASIVYQIRVRTEGSQFRMFIFKMRCIRERCEVIDRST